jgi:hypothetical protein
MKQHIFKSKYITYCLILHQTVFSFLHISPNHATPTPWRTVRRGSGPNQRNGRSANAQQIKQDGVHNKNRKHLVAPATKVVQRTLRNQPPEQNQTDYRRLKGDHQCNGGRDSRVEGQPRGVCVVHHRGNKAAYYRKGVRLLPICARPISFDPIKTHIATFIQMACT